MNFKELRVVFKKKWRNSLPFNITNTKMRHWECCKLITVSLTKGCQSLRVQVDSPTWKLLSKSFRPHDLSRFDYIKVVSSTLQPKIFCEDRWTYCPQGAAVVFDRITVKLVHRKIVVDLEESTDAKHGACKVESRCTEPPRETKIGSKTPRRGGGVLNKV